jgi:hypothetical protein
MECAPMAETEQKEKSRSTLLESKFWRVFLLLVAVALVFGGPTYFVYVLVHAADLSQVYAASAGFVSFVVGLVLLWYLIKNKVVS